MGANLTSYAPEEIDAIARWLHDGLTGSQIADSFSASFRLVSRSAIQGIVHRNKRLKQIGFAEPGHASSGGQHGKPMKTRRELRARSAAKTKQTLHAGNIRNKRESPQNDPEFLAPTPQIIDDGVSPHVYDGASFALKLVDLKARDCRFPINHARPGEDHLFCGRLALPGRPYCGHHCRRAGAGYRAEAA